jgi:hypothetical protein
MGSSQPTWQALAAYRQAFGEFVHAKAMEKLLGSQGCGDGNLQATGIAPLYEGVQGYIVQVNVI